MTIAPKDLIKEQLENLIVKTKESVTNLKKVAIDEAWKILQLAVASVVQTIEKLAGDLAGSEKKQIAMEFLSSFYDRVFVVIDIPFVPNILEPIIHRYVKTLLMIMVSASVDATVTIFRNTGIFLKKEAKL
jgi:hypothetical protein